MRPEAGYDLLLVLVISSPRLALSAVPGVRSVLVVRCFEIPALIFLSKPTATKESPDGSKLIAMT
jgi:hypothetical protein